MYSRNPCNPFVLSPPQHVVALSTTIAPRESPEWAFFEIFGLASAAKAMLRLLALLAGAASALEPPPRFDLVPLHWGGQSSFRGFGLLGSRVCWFLSSPRHGTQRSNTDNGCLVGLGFARSAGSKGLPACGYQPGRIGRRQTRSESSWNIFSLVERTFQKHQKIASWLNHGLSFFCRYAQLGS